MKVKEVMSLNPIVCNSTDNLAIAAGLMWDHDCGVLPVLGEDGRVIGLVTDRDICMTAALNDRNLADFSVEHLIQGEVISCTPESDIKTALKAMADNKVRRLPVISEDGSLEGMLSINDLVLKAEDSKSKKVDVSYEDVISACKAICEHRSAEPKAISANA